MEEDNRIPVYLITGFLDSGKTTLLIDTMSMDYFNDGERTVLILCEEGETEYDPSFLFRCNCAVETVENMEDLNHEFLCEIDRKYQPERILMEYNGMWPIQHLRDLQLPDTWGLYQVIDMIDGSTFDVYRANTAMQSMIIDMVTDADLVLFNRCTGDMPLSAWKRSIRAVSRMATIVFEDDQQNEFEVEDIIPYSLDGDSFEVEDADYGIWYLDVQEHPERYLGKKVTFKALTMTGTKLPGGSFIPGRHCMTCCVEDIRFFGYLCYWHNAPALRKGEWVTVTAQIRSEYSPVYEEEGVVLYADRVVPAAAPEDPLIYFR